MNILIIGNGAREHAILSVLNKQINANYYVLPSKKVLDPWACSVDIKITDIDSILKFIIDKCIDWVFVGPELPLSLGLVNVLNKNKIPVFGTTQEATLFESSKSYAKNFMQDMGIPTASYQCVTSLYEGEAQLERMKYPLVMKIDGLAQGKGVEIVSDSKEAKIFLEEVFLYNKFPSSPKKVIMEEYLTGKEISLFLAIDGNVISTLGYVQDYKKLLDSNLGVNTGGMGSVFPVPRMENDNMISSRISNEILLPFLVGLKRKNILYKGLLYIGLMIDSNNNPYVLEFNTRLGDPEAQVLLPSLNCNFLDLASAIYNQRLNQFDISHSHNYRVCVVLAAKGYPKKPILGEKIFGIEEIDPDMCFFAGVDFTENQYFTSSGRVLSILGKGSTLQSAIDHAYKNVNKIRYQNMIYRTDIGKDCL